MSMNKILAVKLADLGDSLLTVPALRALKTAYPSARLDVLTTATGRPILEGLPFVDNLLTFDKYQYDQPGAAFSPQKLQTARRFLLDLRREKYDTVIFFHHFSTRWGALKFRGLAQAVGAKYRVGLDNGTPEARFLNVRVPDGGFGAEGLSERAYWRKLVEALTARVPSAPLDYDERPDIFIPPESRESAAKLFAEIRNLNPAQPVIAISPGSGGYALSRRWLPRGFAQVGDVLHERYGAKIALVGGRDESDLADEIIALAGLPDAYVNLCGKTGLKEVAAFLQNCALFVGNDGGLAQVAGAVGTPGVVIFGPTNAVAWSPFGTESGTTRIVQSRAELPCRPCLYRGKTLGSRLGCAARPCLTTITPENVLETIGTLKVSEISGARAVSQIRKR
jgi:ADP-heptose:LPS heptosyltransferase